MEKVGFVNVEFIGETRFNSSPVTRGALFRARKGITSEARILRDPIAADRDETRAMPGEDARRSPEGSPA
jgi:hypothetical protein